MDINDRIREVCKNKKIKNIDLVQLGCGSQQTVSFVLTGKVKPNIQFIEVFLKSFNDINARWLLIGQEEKEEDKAEDPRAQYGFCKECIKKEGIIEHLQKEVTAKDKRILELEIKLAGTDGRVDSQAGKKSKAS